MTGMTSKSGCTPTSVFFTPTSEVSTPTSGFSTPQFRSFHTHFRGFRPQFRIVGLEFNHYLGTVGFVALDDRRLGNPLLLPNTVET